MTDRISSEQDEVVQEMNFTEEPLLRTVAAEDHRVDDEEAPASVQPNYGSIAASNGNQNGHGSGAASRGHHSDANGQPKPQASTPSKPARDLAPDLLRGLLMVLMAFDHVGVTLMVWAHGQGIISESDSQIVERFNWALPYTLRTLTHLCAPGFTFLLGMGVVYFGRSRSRLGWGAGKMARHFLVRAVVLTLVSILFGLLISGFEIWFFNIVLFALAVDYLIAGLLYLVLSATEQALARSLVRNIPDEPEEEVREPMISAHPGDGDTVLRSSDRVIVRASRVSWHVHNAILVVLAVVTIFWNIWASPTHGHCPISDEQLFRTEEYVISDNVWVILRNVWFYPVKGTRIISAFPPMAWLSFAIVGLLYGRIVLAQRWNPRTLSLGNALAALGFFAFFVLTRLLHFGNLSEDCLRTTRPHASGGGDGGNQYLRSPEAFFYLVKYPPDVAFWAYTLGGNFLLLSLLGAIPARIGRRLAPLLAYGTSALFFYVVHILLLAVICVPIVRLFGEPMDWNDEMSGKPAVGVKSVPAFFGVWVLILVIMYPLCRWYGAFKGRQGPDSLWRFF